MDRKGGDKKDENVEFGQRNDEKKMDKAPCRHFSTFVRADDLILWLFPVCAWRRVS